MTTLQDGAAADAAGGADRCAQIERALANYPNLNQDELADTIAWFKQEASALDVGMIASNPAITEPYRRFRADHLDKLEGRDILRGLLFAAMVSMVVIVIVWCSL